MMKRHEIDPSELERRNNRRIKSPGLDRRPPVRRESPMMTNRGPPRNDPYDSYQPPRPKLIERETHAAYKILCVGKFTKIQNLKKTCFVFFVFFFEFTNSL